MGTEDEPPLEERDVQRPLEMDPTAYAELGAVQVGLGPDGLPVIGGEPPPKTIGLYAETFICNAAPASDATGGTPRERCSHLAQIVLDAEGVGDFGPEDLEKRPKRIRRFCRALASQSELMELSDTNVYACDLRSPPDLQSQRVIKDFEARQRAVADEARVQGKSFEV